ncbi:RmlC-like cupin domain-containing protein [Paraphysoderma sedebokerense]|nr:RmlC-like cupin domain-containing protein [Paraphysoderma sedebokerense]
MTDSSSYDDIPTPSCLDELCLFLHKELGVNGLDSKEVDVNRVINLMEKYSSNIQDWEKYALFDSCRYTRNLVDDGNGKFNLLILCWNSNQSSPIHDHAKSHCCMKMLDGELVETRYDWPNGPASLKETDEVMDPVGMKVTQTTVLQKDQVAYIHDKIGIHRVSNPSSKPAISLHLYTPPIKMCKTFCEKTGIARPTSCCVFYSKNGQKLCHVDCSSNEKIKPASSLPTPSPSSADVAFY